MVASVGMAVLDTNRVVDEWNEGNIGVSIAYGVSAGLGLTVLFAFSFTGPVGLLVGIVSIALLFGVGVFIETFKDNKVQDWVERCLWGKLESQRYRNLDIEMGQLNMALEA